MNKKIKLLMVIIFVIIIIIICILIYLLSILKDNGQLNLEEDEIYYSNQDIHFRNEIENVTSKYDFFDTETCINKYINLLQKLNKDSYEEEDKVIDQTIEVYKKELYNLLDSTYIKEYQLDIDNLDKKFADYYTTLNFQIKNMYVLDEQEELSIYFVYGNLVNTANNKIEDYGFIVKRDTKNLRFSIIPYDYMLENDYKEELIKNKNLDNIKNGLIEEKDNNYYMSNAYDEEYISNYYFNTYKRNLQFNVKDVYNSMDEEYRKKRFGTLQEYEKYVKDNYNDLLKCNLNQYIKEIENDYTNYICKDQFNNYYIFKEINIGEYILSLDTYTLEQEKFNEKYEVATNNEKVGMNIIKFFQMINGKDYRAAYSLLANNFKNSNFRTEDNFKKYVQTKLYSYNDIKLVNFSDDISGIYTYYIEISNKENEKDSKIKMNIIMQLLENTEYQLSFEIID